MPLTYLLQQEQFITGFMTAAKLTKLIQNPQISRFTCMYFFLCCEKILCVATAVSRLRLKPLTSMILSLTTFTGKHLEYMLRAEHFCTND